MAGIKSEFCNKTACSNIWDFCITKKLLIPGGHIPDVSNKETDKQPTIFSWIVSPYQ